MSKFVGARNGKIKIISDKAFENSDFEIYKLPEELEDISTEDLLLNYKLINGKLINKQEKKQAKDLKIAFVTNWKMQCGIASYGKALYSQIIPYIKDYKLFIEYNPNPIESLNLINDEYVASDKIVECWKRGENLSELISEIKQYDPDIVLINHEFGLYPNARHLLSMMTQLNDYRIITTMHSIFHHQDKTICEAAMPEIIVHLPGAKQVLEEEKKISGKVYIIPHGCEPCLNPRKLWNLYRSNKTFMQMGYLFAYKGWENCLRATEIIKKKHPDVFFTGVLSESPYAKLEHQKVFDELTSMIKGLGISDNVALIRGFQSEQVLDSFLRTNQVAVFPYISHKEHEVFGSSGAAPTAMSKGIPVITSMVNHFAELPSLKASKPEEIAELLERLFLDKKFKDEQIKKQNKYLEDNSWKNVAQKYLDIFTG